MSEPGQDPTPPRDYYCQICEEAQATQVAFYTAPALAELGVAASETDSALCPSCLEVLQSAAWAELGYRFHFATPFGTEYLRIAADPQLWPYPGE
jgi:hypothetical protein